MPEYVLHYMPTNDVTATTFAPVPAPPPPPMIPRLVGMLGASVQCFFHATVPPMPLSTVSRAKRKRKTCRRK